MQDRIWSPLVLLSRNAVSALTPDLRNRVLVLLFIFSALLLSNYQGWAQSKPEQPAQDSPSQTSQEPGTGQATTIDGAQQGLVHIVPFGRTASPIKNTLAPAGAHLTYWGGPVVSQVHVIAVFWGTHVDSSITAGIGQFFTDITSSRYYDLLTEYSTVGVTGSGVPATSSNQFIQHGLFDGAVTITPTVCNVTPPATCTIDDAQIQTELNAQIAAGHLPAPVNDTKGNVESYYMIYFPPGVSITIGTVKSCVSGGFCAYHSNTANALYGVQPDFAPPSGCSLGCGTGATLFQKATAVTSHELSEAVTDPQVGSATTTAPPLAWYDPDPATNPLGEIGDICAGQDITVTAGANTYFVQTEFSNLQNDCVSAPPNFLLNPPAAVAPGVSFNMALGLLSSTGPMLVGYAGTVHFTSSDPAAVLPPDYTFTAADAGVHAFAFTLSALGDQTITVTDTRSAGFFGTATTNVNTIPDLTISMTHGGTFALGQSGSYNITVSNTGQGPTTSGVTVVDTLPANLTATAISGAGWNCTLGSLTCTRADVLARGSSYPAITVSVNVGANAPSSVINVATVSGGGETNTSNNVASDFTNIAAPDMVINKSHAGVINGNFFQGETGATYTITVVNIGGAPTTAPVTVVDTFPAAGLTATAISGTGWNCTLANLTCTRSDVLAPVTGYPFITVTVDVAPNAPPNIVNTATVSGGGETNTTNNVVQDLTNILPPPATDLAISVSHPSAFIQGLSGTYLINITNVGTAATSGAVTLTDTIPTGLTANSIAGTGWACDLLTLTCTRSDVLNFSASYPTITLSVNVAANAPASVTNSVSVAGGGDTNTSNNTASDVTSIAAPLVDLVPSVGGPARVTQADTNVAFTLHVDNFGNIGSTGKITVTDTLSSGFVATAISGAGWTCTLSNITCTRSDSLSPATSFAPVTVMVNVAANAPSQATHTIVVTGGGDAAPANNTATFPVTVTPLVGLTNNSANNNTVAAGQSLKYFFAVTVSQGAGTVTMSCSGLPAASSCAFSQPSLTISANITMTISTTQRAAAIPAVPPGFGNRLPNFVVLVASIFLGLMVWINYLKRFARLRLILALSLVAILMVLMSCGGGKSTPVTGGGTPAGTYSITVTASSPAASASQVVPLTVQ